MRRKIIDIDHEKCNGCGLCISDCPEGALQVIDGKARLVGDPLCDGLGACLKACPQDAISVEERDTAPYDELKVMENILPQGHNVILAHLKHLRDHRQTEYLQQALIYLEERHIPVGLPPEAVDPPPATGQCPGVRSTAFAPAAEAEEESGSRPSRLTHWPVQLHLISPAAPHYRNSHLLVAADCVAFAHADFHKDFLTGRTLAIACPKLDTKQEAYLEKLTTLIDQAKIKSIQVMIMQVPCCGGLLRHVIEAVNRATHKPPIHCIIVGIRGEILSEIPVEPSPAEVFAS